jgi:hypothetical protein
MNGCPRKAKDKQLSKAVIHRIKSENFTRALTQTVELELVPTVTAQINSLPIRFPNAAQVSKRSLVRNNR